MKIANFFRKSAFKFQIVESVLLSFEPPTPPFTLVQLDRGKKTLTICSSRFIFSRDLLHPEKILEKLPQLHDDCDQKSYEKENSAQHGNHAKILLLSFRRFSTII